MTSKAAARKAPATDAVTDRGRGASTRTIAVTNLLFDLRNPRTDEQPSQRDALRELVRQQGEKLLNLAGDIVEHGLDPSSVPLVVPVADDPENCVVVEGNRRLAALKALSNPDLVLDVLDSRGEKRLRALSERFAERPITSVPCVLLGDAEHADHWIELRHRGEQQGRGIVSWGGIEATRFEERRGGGRSNAALQALNLVRTRGELDAATIDRLSNVPITTVQRLLNDPDVRARLGVDIADGRLTTTLPEREVLKGLVRIIRDAATGQLPVSRVDSKKDRANYVNSFGPNELPAKRAKHGDPRPLEPDPSAAPPSQPRRKTRPPTAQRRPLIPRGCVLSIPDGKANNVYHELRKLPVDDFPNAVGVLFRVFLELSADRYILAHKLQTKAQLDVEKKLRQKITRAADHLLQIGAMTKRDLTAARRAADPNHFLASSVETLHSYVHDATFAPPPGDLKAAWDSLQAFVEHLWN